MLRSPTLPPRPPNTSDFHGTWKKRADCSSGRSSDCIWDIDVANLSSARLAKELTPYKSITSIKHAFMPGTSDRYSREPHEHYHLLPGTSRKNRPEFLVLAHPKRRPFDQTTN